MKLEGGAGSAVAGFAPTSHALQPAQPAAAARYLGAGQAACRAENWQVALEAHQALLAGGHVNAAIDPRLEPELSPLVESTAYQAWVKAR